MTDGYVKKYLKKTTTKYGETYAGVESKKLSFPVECSNRERLRIRAFFKRKEFDIKFKEKENEVH